MITFEGVTRRFGSTVAVDDLSLTIAGGQCTVLIGSSGSGKSTLLRMINRLVPHDAGRIEVGGQDVRSVAPEVLRRRMGYAIQSVGLFPHWTVARNVATVPQLLGWPRARVDSRVEELLALLQLPVAQYGERYPHQLSGGQQQRVGVARALAGDPEVLLMDEPFGALDPVTRATLQRELGRIQRQSGKTLVLVTHDVDEALRLADRIVLLERGRIVQAGTPTDLLAHPANPFVSEFFGPSERGLRLLGLRPLAALVRPLSARDADAARDARGAPGATIALDASCRDALSACAAAATDQLTVLDAQDRAIGVVRLADLVAGVSATAPLGA